VALVWIPPRLQPLAAGRKQVEVEGATVRQVIDSLEAQFPGFKTKLYDAERDSLARGIAVTVNAVTSELGLLEGVGEDSEVHFLAAVAGG
jgi:molybdopterin converting factor small subunit